MGKQKLRGPLRDQEAAVRTLFDSMPQVDDEIRWLLDRIKCVVRNCEQFDQQISRDEPVMSGPTWSKVARMTGLGSTSAIELCRACDIDPHFDIGVKRREEMGGDDDDE